MRKKKELKEHLDAVLAKIALLQEDHKLLTKRKHKREHDLVEIAERIKRLHTEKETLEWVLNKRP